MTGIKGRRPPNTGAGSGWYAPDDIDTGSILYVDSDRLIKGLTPGATDKIIKSTGLTPNIPSYQDDDTGGGGGGTVLYDHWDPLVPDASPHAMSCEFDASSLAQFTVVNSRDTIDADTTVTNMLWHSLTSHQYRFVCHLEALPGDTNWTMHTAVEGIGHPQSTLFHQSGLVISNTNTTNTGQQTFVGFGREVSVSERCIINWNVFGESASGAAFPYRAAHGGSGQFIRVRKQSGSYFAAWSGDGRVWHETALTIFGGITPAYVGVYVQNYSGTTLEAGFHYFRYYDNGTQYLTGAAADVLG